MSGKTVLTDSQREAIYEKHFDCMMSGEDADAIIWEIEAAVLAALTKSQMEANASARDTEDKYQTMLLALPGIIEIKVLENLDRYERDLRNGLLGLLEFDRASVDLAITDAGLGIRTIKNTADVAQP